MDKLRKVEELKATVGECRRRGLKVAFANGCFDLIHVGHVRYLRAARELADRLIVAINSDESVRELKGAGRPLMSESDRAEIVGAFSCVDDVVIFREASVDRLLGLLKPDFHCKGTDYTPETVPERETVLAYGGEIAIVGDEKVRSTRGFLERIRR